MADVHTREIRSYNMSRIKGKDTKPEMLVRRFLHANGFPYKLHDKSLPEGINILIFLGLVYCAKKLTILPLSLWSSNDNITRCIY